MPKARRMRAHRCIPDSLSCLSLSKRAAARDAGRAAAIRTDCHCGPACRSDNNHRCRVRSVPDSRRGLHGWRVGRPRGALAGYVLRRSRTRCVAARAGAGVFRIRDEDRRETSDSRGSAVRAPSRLHVHRAGAPHRPLRAALTETVNFINPPLNCLRPPSGPLRTVLRRFAGYAGPVALRRGKPSPVRDVSSLAPWDGKPSNHPRSRLPTGA